MPKLGADLIVGCRPGKGFEHFRRTCSGRHDAGDDAVIEMADDLDDFGSGGGPRRRVHRKTLRCCAGNANREQFAPPGFPKPRPGLTSTDTIGMKNQWLFALFR